MAKKTITIDQIFRGWSATQYFGSEGTYNSSIAIDPDLPISQSDIRTSGYAVPVGSSNLSTTATTPIIRLITTPKTDVTYCVQSNSVVISLNSAQAELDNNWFATGFNATWAEYYNNYIYLFGTGSSKNDISRIGPLNTLPYDAQTGNFTVGLTVTGASSGATGIITSDVDGGASGTLTLSNISGRFSDNELITDTSTGSATVNRDIPSMVVNGVWTGATLGTQTALTNTKYPTLQGVDLPNHVAYVHGDGAMYFCDFKNGQGLIHKINTTRTTNEGDTNSVAAPSTYNVLDLPFGFYPTSICGFGTSLLIAGIYTTDDTINQGNAAFVLWDPTDTNSFYAGPIPLPDPLVTATLNVNGVVYIWTGNAQNGVRISTYTGGSSVQELVYLEEGYPPSQAAVDALGNRIVWGGRTTYPSVGASVWAWGSKRADLPAGLHNVMSTAASSVELCDSYSESNYSTDASLSFTYTGAGFNLANNMRGQSFTGNGGKISSCKFYLKRSSSYSGSVKAMLYAHSGTFGTSSVGSPSNGVGALATSNTIAVSSLSETYELVEFNFTTKPTLTNGTKYVVCVSTSGQTTGVSVGVDTTAQSHAGNGCTLTSTTASVWASSSADTIFYVYTGSATPNVTGLKYNVQDSNVTPKVLLAWTDEAADGYLEKYSSSATLKSQLRWMFPIGKRFSIERVTIPFAGEVDANTTITPTLYFDDLSSNVTLPTINNTNYPSKRKVLYKGTSVKDCTGLNNFMLDLTWTGTNPLPVAFPITIVINESEDEE